MEKFVVIDTETTWTDEVMSIGAVIADSDTMLPLESKYYILDPEYRTGGMYSDVLLTCDVKNPIICSRSEALNSLIDWCKNYCVNKVFAYNAVFDRNHLPELAGMRWFDIMKLAAYIQYNHKIPRGMPLCSTGRLKSGYGVQSILRILAGDITYQETHNALKDRLDELKIMSLLGYPIERYI